MAWPSPSDYLDALQNPQRAFSDSALQRGIVTVNQWGLPRPISGNFATVFEVKTGPKQWAVRCFSREVSDQQPRYAALHTYLSRYSLPYMAGFEYLPQGILVRGKWYPIVKMQWVEGEQLDTFVRTRLNDPRALQQLAQKWVSLVQSLRDVAIAHGDLQHGNIIVTPQGDLKLVDYDGMVIPALASQRSQEDGHRNYQHPTRVANPALGRNNFLNLDNFSAWVISISLALVSLDPGLWARTQAGEDRLLFQEADYKQPSRSATLQMLNRHEDVRVRDLARRLMMIISAPSYLQVPPLTSGEINIARPSAKAWMGDGGQVGESQETLQDFYPDDEEDTRPALSSRYGQSWIQDYLPREAHPTRESRRSVFQPVLVPLPKIEFDDDWVAAEAENYLAEKQRIPYILHIVFSVRRFVARRFEAYPEVIDKRSAEQVYAQTKSDLLAAEKTLRESQTKLARLRKEIAAQVSQLHAGVQSLNEQIDDSHWQEKDELRKTIEQARERYIHQRLAQHVLVPRAISGFGKARIDALNQAGIYSAADIHSQNEMRVRRALAQVRGAYPNEEWQDLVRWRRSIETSITHTRVVTVEHEYRIADKYRTLRQELSGQRDVKVAQLHIAEQRATKDPLLRQLESSIQQAEQAIVQGQSDLAVAERDLDQYSEITIPALVQRIREALSYTP